MKGRLDAARLYLVCDIDAAERVLAPALAGGVDVVQLRDKHADDDALVEAAGRFRRLCDEHGALFVLNDRPDLVAACGADGVHVGQDDARVDAVRAAVGPDVLIGLSTHSPAQVDGALASDADYFAVGPVHATPTKPTYEPVGLELVRYAAAHADRPWFAIGGIDTDNVGEVFAAGAQRVAVVRAICEAADPAEAARLLAGERVG